MAFYESFLRDYLILEQVQALFVFIALLFIFSALSSYKYNTARILVFMSFKKIDTTKKNTITKMSSSTVVRSIKQLESHIFDNHDDSRPVVIMTCGLAGKNMFRNT